MAEPPTILVVEDDPVILDLLAVNFELEGYTVVRAVDGEDGLATARRFRPAAVVTDIMMPKRSGLDLLRDLRADADLAAVPVILAVGQGARLRRPGRPRGRRRRLRHQALRARRAARPGREAHRALRRR